MARPFKFTNLPAELRMMIWRLLFEEYLEEGAPGMDAMGFIHQASDHVTRAIMSNRLIFIRFKKRLCPGLRGARLVQFLSMNSGSRGIFISLLRSNKGKGNGLKEIFTHRRTWSPTLRMLYIKDFGVYEDESLL